MKRIIYLFAAIALFGCKKYEGTGGRASVKGKIYVKNYNDSFTQLIDEYYGAEERVYIMYGESDIYNDEMRANFDGSFKFDFLEKGNYTIFVYSNDSTFTVPGGKEPLFFEFEIKEKKDVIDLGDIVILD